MSDADRFDIAAPAIVKPPSGHWGSSDPDDQLEVGILRQFPFSSELQVMLSSALPAECKSGIGRR